MRATNALFGLAHCSGDIRIAADVAYGDDEDGGGNTYQQQRPLQPRNTDVRLDYSLRQYVSVLYKVRLLGYSTVSPTLWLWR